MALDIDAYLQRIRWLGDIDQTLETLSGIMRAHMAAIPFENLDALLRRPVRLDVDSLQSKLVGARRGGYCFEHASLFAAALEAIGFQPSRCAARVVLFAPRTDVPRDHMFLTVPVDGVTYVVDPGFGPFAPPGPVPLVEGRADAATHWMERDGPLWVLNVSRGEDAPAMGWVSTMEPENAIDFEVSNHYIATHTASLFTNWIMMSAVTLEGRVNVMNRDVTILSEAEPRSVTLRDRTALRGLLLEHFGFDLPEVETMTVPAIPEWG